MPLVDAATDRPDLPRAAVIAEDIVGGQADLPEVGDALLVAGGRVDEVAGVFRQGDLRRGDDIGVIGRCCQTRIDLEVDVRPAAAVAGWEDALEGDHAVISGRLDAAQVVLIRGALGVERVAPRLIAVPDIDSRARIR